MSSRSRSMKRWNCRCSAAGIWWHWTMLRSLAGLDPRKSQIVELRFFGGLSVEETAEVMNISPITVMREWNKAKAWLYHELSQNRT